MDGRESLTGLSWESLTTHFVYSAFSAATSTTKLTKQGKYALAVNLIVQTNRQRQCNGHRNINLETKSKTNNFIERRLLKHPGLFKIVKLNCFS